jgi:hypothetical protein
MIVHLNSSSIIQYQLIYIFNKFSTAKSVHNSEEEPPKVVINQNEDTDDGFIEV